MLTPNNHNLKPHLLPKESQQTDSRATAHSTTLPAHTSTGALGQHCYVLLCSFEKSALCVAVSPCNYALCFTVLPFKVCPLFLQEFFLGSGGVFGLLQALVGEVLPGAARCVAVGNALLQGPVVFHFPQHVVARIKERALEGDPDVMQLLVDLYRWGHPPPPQRFNAAVLNVTKLSHT